MPLYPNPNGGSMQAANDADARAKCWTPSMGTFGVNTYPDSSGGDSSGGGGGVPQTTQQQAVQQVKQAASAFGNVANTMTQAQLDEQKREFDANLAWQQQMWTNQGLPQLVIQQRSQALQEQEFQFQMQMAQQNLALQTVQAAAQLGGPQNWVQAVNFERGIRQTDIPDFLNKLFTSTPTNTTTGSAGLGAPETLSSLASKMGAGSTDMSGTAPDMNQSVNLGKSIFAAGGGALGPQALEGLNPSEQGMLTSLGSAVGADVPGFMAQYARSRIGQSAAQAA